jgi:hypothetical protein
MKKVLIVIFLSFLSIPGFAQDSEEKTFLVIFDKSELKANKTSTEFLELSLMNLFSTKAYNGNSDAAIMVKIPHEGMDVNQLGDMIIRVNDKKIVPLSEIAVQIIDLDQSKSTYSSLLSSYEERLLKTKKASKAVKASPAL